MTFPLIEIAETSVNRGSGSEGFVLSIPSIRIERFSQLAVVGPSGSGKSTFLELVGLLTSPKIAKRFSLGLKDRVIDVPPLWEQRKTAFLAALRAGNIGYVLQNGGLLPYLSVWDNVVLTARLSGNFNKDFAKNLCYELGISDLLHRFPAQLSVGQRQRVAIARALSHQPSLIIADEPTSALDLKNAENVMLMLTNLAKQSGSSLLCATHNLSLAEKFSLSPLICEKTSKGQSLVQVTE